MRLVSVVLALLLRALLVTAQCQTCSCNGCLATLDPNARYAISSSAEPSASSACYSWAGMSTTITPPTVTTTSTYTQNVSVGATTTTNTQVTSTLVIVGTVTSTQYSTNVVQTVTTAVATASTTSTVIVTSTAPNPSTKSYLRRQATSASVAAAVPTQYAPYCSASSAFSSACRCIGITQRTSTATAPTTTATVTVTQSVVSGTAILVVTSTMSATRNTVTTRTSSVVIGTTTVSTANTVTTARILTTATTTVTASNTVSTATPSGYLRVRAAATSSGAATDPSASAAPGSYVSGMIDGRWLYYSKPAAANGVTKLKLGRYSDVATKWTLVNSPYGAYLKSADLGVQAVMNSWDGGVAGPANGFDVVSVASPAYASSPLALVTCSDPTSANGPLRCATTRDGAYNQTGRTIFQYCNDASSNETGTVVLDSVLETGCVQLDLYWESSLPTTPYILNTDKKNYIYPRNQYLYIKNTTDNARCGINKPLLVDWARTNFRNSRYGLAKIFKHYQSRGNLIILDHYADDIWSSNLEPNKSADGAYNYTAPYKNWTINWSEKSIRQYEPTDMNTSFLTNGPLFDTYRLPYQWQQYNTYGRMENQLFDRYSDDEYHVYLKDGNGTAVRDKNAKMYPWYRNQSITPAVNDTYTAGIADPAESDSDLNGFHIGLPMSIPKYPIWYLTSLGVSLYLGEDPSLKPSYADFNQSYIAPAFENNTYNNMAFSQARAGQIGECNLWSDGHIDCSEINRHGLEFYEAYAFSGSSVYLGGNGQAGYPPYQQRVPTAPALQFNGITNTRFQACPSKTSEVGQNMTNLMKVPGGRYYNWYDCADDTPGNYNPSPDAPNGCASNAYHVNFLGLPQNGANYFGSLHIEKGAPNPGCCDVELHMARDLEDIPNWAG